MTKYAYSLNELHFGENGKMVKVAPHTTFPLSAERYDEFEALNAIRPATADEIKIAKASDGSGVTETDLAAEQKRRDDEAEAARLASEKKLADDAAAKASAALAAETDRNREEAKQKEAADKAAADKAAKPAKAAKNDPLA